MIDQKDCPICNAEERVAGELRCQRCLAAAIDEKNAALVALASHNAELLSRNGELTAHNARLRVFEGLLGRMGKARAKYPNGCTALSLFDEVGEFSRALNKFEGIDRVLDELLDVAAVAMRLHLGEVDAMPLVRLEQRKTNIEPAVCVLCAARAGQLRPAPRVGRSLPCWVCGKSSLPIRTENAMATCQEHEQSHKGVYLAGDER